MKKTFVAGFAFAASVAVFSMLGCSSQPDTPDGERTASVQESLDMCEDSGTCRPGECGLHPYCVGSYFVNCGGCPAGEVCSSTTMTCVACKARRTCPPRACGTFDDGCGGQFCCGSADYCCN